MTILGLGGLLDHAAVAVLKDGRLVAAIEQHKLTRNYTPGTLPLEAIETALALAGVGHNDVQIVALARPFASVQGGAAGLHVELRRLFPGCELAVVDHHTAHAASAFYASPFDDATVLTLDDKGDFRCGARWQGRGGELRLEHELYLPDSLGDLYSRVTELLGFHARSEEHKVQWLSAAGDDRFVPLFRRMIGGDGWPAFDRSWFDADRPAGGGFSDRFYDELHVDDQVPKALHPHIAAGVQRAIEQTVVQLAGNAERVCLAGGLCFNALLVAALEQHAQVFVQPAAGNTGTAVGAAYQAWHLRHPGQRAQPMDTLALGPSYGSEPIKQVLENCKLHFRYLLTNDEVVDVALRALGEHRIVAWMQGPMEFGPRALGNRSILASPLDPYSTENLNVYIKRREPFRKFAASVPAELAAEYFEAGPNARYLATVGRVREQHRATFEGAILAGDMVRVHAVHEADNPLYYRLLQEAGKSTGLPVLYNTSFNLFGDPLVCTPRDAVRSFYSSGVDAMLVGQFLLEK